MRVLLVACSPQRTLHVLNLLHVILVIASCPAYGLHMVKTHQVGRVLTLTYVVRQLAALQGILQALTSGDEKLVECALYSPVS